MLSSYDNELTVIFLAFDFRNFVGIQFVANHVLAKANAGIIVKKSSIQYPYIKRMYLIIFLLEWLT
jgi:hypothetical protein